MQIVETRSSAPPESIVPSRELASAALAHWAEEARANLKWSIVPRLLFFLVVIPVGFAVAVWMHYGLIVGTIVAGLGIANFFEQASRMLDRFPKLRNFGPLGKVLGLTISMRDFYKENKPGWFAYYVFYPLAAPFVVFLRPLARKELKLWGKTLLIIVSGDLLNLAVTYSATYPPYLGVRDALWMTGVHLLAAFVFSVACLMPVMTTAFTLTFTGKGKSLAALTIASLTISIAASGGLWWWKHNTISLTSRHLLEQRMAKPDFRKDIRVTSDVILTFLEVRTPDAAKAKLPDGIARVGGATDKFHDMINHVAPNDEPKAFQVVSIRDSSGSIWFGIQYWDADKRFLLFAMDSAAKIYSSWASLPQSFQEDVEAAFATSLAKYPGDRFVTQMADDFSTR